MNSGSSQGGLKRDRPDEKESEDEKEESNHRQRHIPQLAYQNHHQQQHQQQQQQQHPFMQRNLQLIQSTNLPINDNYLRQVLRQNELAMESLMARNRAQLFQNIPTGLPPQLHNPMLYHQLAHLPPQAVASNLLYGRGLGPPESQLLRQFRSISNQGGLSGAATAAVLNNPGATLGAAAASRPDPLATEGSVGGAISVGLAAGAGHNIFASLRPPLSTSQVPSFWAAAAGHQEPSSGAPMLPYLQQNSYLYQRLRGGEEGATGESVTNRGSVPGAAAAARPAAAAAAQPAAAAAARPLAMGASDARPPAVRGSGGRSKLLHVETDIDSVNTYQCFARKQIELFEATQDDVDAGAQGRNKPIVLGQVGIRCVHCADLHPRFRTRAAVYYPSRLSVLYQAAQNIVNVHLPDLCESIPDEVRQYLISLDNKRSAVGGGKNYWSDTARVQGVCDTEKGLRFADNPLPPSSSSSSGLGGEKGEI